jgi:hypothetical protein
VLEEPSGAPVIRTNQLLLFALCAAPAWPQFLYAAACDSIGCTFEAQYTEPTRMEPVPPDSIGGPLKDLKFTTLYMQADPIGFKDNPIISVDTPAADPHGGSVVALITPQYPLLPGHIVTMRFWATATNNFGESKGTHFTLVVDRSLACPPQIPNGLTVR